MARIRKPEPSSVVDGVPPELLDRDAEVWADPVAYERYMDDHGYHLDVHTRLDALGTSSRRRATPERRRRGAVEGWATANGIVGRWPDHPDWSRLRDLEVV